MQKIEELLAKQGISEQDPAYNLLKLLAQGAYFIHLPKHEQGDLEQTLINGWVFCPFTSLFYRIHRLTSAHVNQLITQKHLRQVAFPDATELYVPQRGIVYESGWRDISPQECDLLEEAMKQIATLAQYERQLPSLLCREALQLLNDINLTDAHVEAKFDGRGDPTSPDYKGVASGELWFAWCGEINDRFTDECGNEIQRKHEGPPKAGISYEFWNHIPLIQVSLYDYNATTPHPVSQILHTLQSHLATLLPRWQGHLQKLVELKIATGHAIVPFWELRCQNHHYSPLSFRFPEYVAQTVNLPE